MSPIKTSLYGLNEGVLAGIQESEHGGVYWPCLNGMPGGAGKGGTGLLLGVGAGLYDGSPSVVGLWFTGDCWLLQVL
ncbi:hypothetical protein [Labrenzia sp. OB1]|uniref:hypothetical protein n=1 Tax=Labrenzia sp. OB1 TaxID=1561204 RepID=UPI001AD8DFA0|nr:hypothetical protein [Labrenzia sp. OB1]